MWNRIFSIVILSSFITTQLFAQSQQNGLKAAFDELQYSLTVEWDQIDSRFHDKKIEDFKAEIDRSIKAGMSKNEVFSILTSQISNKKVLKEAIDFASQVDVSKMSSSELTRQITEHLSHTYSAGASWNSQDSMLGFYIFIGVAVGAVVFYLAWCNASSENESACTDD